MQGQAQKIFTQINNRRIYLNLFTSGIKNVTEPTLFSLFTHSKLLFQISKLYNSLHNYELNIF